MKKILYIPFLALVALVFVGCTQQKVLNRFVKPESGERYLTGEFEQKTLNQKYYASWYEPEYNSYVVETEKLKDVKTAIKKYRIEVFVGTWCSDSQRELPRLYKILEEIKFPTGSKLKVFGVNRAKVSFYGEEMGKNITHVPTIIIYDKNTEIGRIVESPVSGYLEEDIAMIVKGTPLTPNYAED